MSLSRARTTDEIHEEIKSFLEKTRRKIIVGLEEREQKNQWDLNVKQESSNFKILHPLDKDYFYIIFGYQVDEFGKGLLEKNYSGTNNVIDFNYELLSSISYPNTSCSFRKMPIPKSDYIYAGFDIVAKVFPFEETYSDQYLESAIQNVINAGKLGIYFFAVKLKSYRELKQFEIPESSSEGMFT